MFQDFTNTSVVKIRTSNLSFPVPPKAKEVYFKMLEIYLCNDLLRQRFNLDLNVCTFCNSDIETMEHLIFSIYKIKYVNKDL